MFGRLQGSLYLTICGIHAASVKTKGELECVLKNSRKRGANWQQKLKKSTVSEVIWLEGGKEVTGGGGNGRNWEKGEMLLVLVLSPAMTRMFWNETGINRESG